MFEKILVANRGEIAVRIIRACKEMGISTVAVYSEADREALHVSLADESFCVGPASVKDSYLNINSIISAALVSGAQAIHPGYGLLSENAKFASICEQCGIAFIGPPSAVIEKMGDKDEAKRTMKNAGVPVVPGCDIVETLDCAKAEAEKIGYPLMIKARSGGGGRGIRVVEKADELDNAFLNASEEAKNAFGDGAVYLEKFLTNIKHVEIQLLCDNYGNVIVLGERDCSVQRKNQKLIEESPCCILENKTRNEMFKASIAAAKACNYRGVGTIEYLLTVDNKFYFMEMNTRLQVEHPVTEIITGIDIVKWQIRIASDLKLDFTQDDIKFDGHAIECRINAENPSRNFCPSPGRISLLHIPGGPWVRFDTAVYQDYTIPHYYDSMVGKLIVSAKTREEAIRKMQAALCELVLEGIEHNSEFQIDILTRDEFARGTYTTDFLSEV